MDGRLLHSDAVNTPDLHWRFHDLPRVWLCEIPYSHLLFLFFLLQALKKSFASFNVLPMQPRWPEFVLNPMQLLSYTQLAYWRESPIWTATVGCLGLNFIITNFLKNNSMKQSPFWEANKLSAIQEIHRLLWNLIHHRALKSLPLVLIINQMDLVYTFPHHFFKIHYNTLLYSHLRLCLQKNVFPSDFPTNILYAFLISPVQFSSNSLYSLVLKS
jgi:hypothetical protein